MKILKNYLYNSFYQVLLIILPVITIPYVTRVLGEEGYGINSYTNSVIQYFLLFGTIGIALYGSKTIGYFAEDKIKRSKVFWELTILKAVTVTLSILAFLLFLFATSQYRFFYLCQSLLLVAGLFDVSWYFMGREDFKKTVFRNTLVKIISLILIFTLIKTPADLWKYILINSLSNVFGQLTLWPYLKNEIIFVKFSLADFLASFKGSLALFIPQIAIQIYSILNKTLLGVFGTMGDVGNFEAADKVVTIVMTLITSLGTVMLPRIANSFGKKDFAAIDRYTKQTFLLISVLAIPISFGLIAIAEPFAHLFFGSKFTTAGLLIQLMSLKIIGVAWTTVIGYQYLLATNQTKKYTVSVFLGALASILINLTITPHLTYIGAGLSVLISEVVVTSYQLYAVRRELDLKNYFFPEILKYFFAAGVMFLAVAAALKFFGAGILGLSLAVGIGALIYACMILLLKTQVVKIAKSAAAQIKR